MKSLICSSQTKHPNQPTEQQQKTNTQKKEKNYPIEVNFSVKKS